MRTRIPASAFVVGAGSLTLGSSGIDMTSAGADATIESDIILGASQPWDIGTGRSLLASGVVSGAGYGITKQGAGTLTLNNANTYTGSTTVVAGTFQLGDGGTGGALSTQSALSVGIGAVLAFNRSSTVTQGTDFGPVLSGAGGVSQFGSGKLTLLGANTYTGPTTVSAGVLNIQNAGALGATAGPTFVASGAALQLEGGITVGAEALTLDGTGAASDGALRNVSGTNVYGGNITLGSASRINSDAGVLTLSGAISGAYSLSVGGGGSLAINGVVGTSTGSLTKDGAGTLTLTGANTFTGPLSINDGVVRIQGAAFSTVARAYNIASGAVLNFVGDTGVATGTSTISGDGTFRVSAGYFSNYNPNTPSSRGRNVNMALNSGAVIDVAAGALLRNGGWQNIDWSDNYAVLNVDGTLDFWDGKTVSAAALTGGGSVLTNYGGSTGIQVGKNSGSGTFSGVIRDAGFFEKIGAGIQVLSGTNTYRGATLVSGGTLQIGVGGTTGRLSTSGSLHIGNGALLAFNQTDTVAQRTDFGPVISGAGSVSQIGSGILVLSGTNTYGGGTTLSAGRLNLNSSAALGTGSLTIAAATTLGNSSGSSVTLNNNAQFWNGSFIFDGGSDLNFGTGAVTLGASPVLTVSAGTLTVGGAISGNYGLTKDGSGWLRLSGANAYTGATSVSAGTLQVGAGGSAGSLSAGGSLSIGSGAVLAFNQTDTVVQGTDFGPVISGAGSVFQLGSGTLVLSGANTYGGGTMLGGGRLNLNGSAALGTGALTIAAATTLGNSSGAAVMLNNHAQFWNGSFTFAGGDDLNLGTGAVTLGASPVVTITTGTLTVGGAISGNYSLSKAGAGSLFLTGANLYTGATTVSAGTLQLGVGGTAGSLDAGGSLSIGSGAVLAFNQTDTVVQGADFGPVISGAGSVQQLGGGTLVLSGTNTYGGGTTLGAGRLNLSSSAALGTGSLTIAAATTLDNSSGSTLTLNNNAQVWNGSFTFAGGSDLNLGTGAVTLGASPVVTISSGTLTVGGVISGNYDLTKAGAGWMLLTGANLYTGTTTVSAGTLQLGAGGTAGRLSAGGALSIGSGAVLVFNQADTVVQGTDFGPVIAGAGSVIQLGSGTLVLSGTNSYSGGTTLEAGRLNLNSSAALGTGALTIANATTLGNSSGSALTLNNNAQVWNGSFTFAGGDDLNLGTGAVTLGASPVVTVSSGTLTVGGAISGNYALTKAGSGWLQLSGANVYNGVTTVNAGTLQVGAGGTTGSLRTGASLSVSSGAVLAFNQTDTVLQGTDFGSVISGAGSVMQLGSGTLVLSGANTFTGALNVNAGVVQMHGSAFSTTARTYNIASGAVLDIVGNTGVPSGTSVIGGSGTFRISTGYFSNESPNNLDPSNLPGPNRNITLTLSSGALIDVGAAAYMKNGGWQNIDWSNNRAVLNVDGSFDFWDGNAVYAAALTGSGTLLNARASTTRSIQVGRDSGSGTFSGVILNVSLFEKIGGGTQVLSGANFYAGATTVTGGVLSIRNGSALGSTAGATTVANGAALQIEGGISVGAEALTLNGGGIASDGALRNVSGANTYGGAVTLGSASRINSDAGTLTLTGGVSGAYLLSVGGAGDLAFSGALATSTGGLFKDGSGTLILSGQNTYTGGTTISAGTLRLGSGGSTGALSATGSLSIGAGAVLAFNQTDTVVQGTDFSSVISGSGSLLQIGSGTLELTGTNTYSGGTTLGAGRLNLNSSAALGTGSLTIADATTLGNSSGAAVTLNNNAQAWGGSFTFAGGSDLNLGTGAVTLGASPVVRVSSGTLTVGGVISGNYGLTKDGSGLLRFSGANAYTGVTLVSAGTLQLGVGGTAGSLAAGGSLSIGSGAALAFNRTDTVEQGTDFGPVISGSGSLLQLGRGTLVLLGANTYSGGTTVGAGTLQLGAGGTAGSLSAVGSLSVSSGAVLAFNRTDTLAQGTDFGHMISGAGSVLQLGSGNLVLSGANTFSGGMTLSNGFLSIENATALGAPASVFTISGGTLDNTSGAALALSNNNEQVWNANVSFRGTNDLDLGAGTVTLGGNRTVTVSAGTLTVGGGVQGGYSLTKEGAGRLILTGTSSYTGATIVNAGTLQIGNGGSAGALSGLSALTNNATLLFNLSRTLTQGTDFGSTIAGTGTLLQMGPGTLVLAGSNTYTGATLISGGTLQIGAGGERGSLFAGGVLTNNATLAFNRSDSVVQGVDFAGTLGGTGALRQVGSGTLLLSGSNTYTGTTWIESGVLQLGSGGVSGSLFAGGAITNNATLAFNRSDTITQGVDFGAAIVGTGQLQQMGSGTLTLNGANAHSGGTTLAAGRLNVNSPGALGSGLFTISAGLLDNTSGGAVTLGSNNAQTWAGDFAFAGSSDLNLGTGNITLGSQRIVTVTAGTLGVGGTIAGPYAFTKAGQGTLELGGSNTFSGMTSVNAGTLRLTNNNALQTSVYNSNSTGVLAFGPAATDPLLGGLTGSGAFAPGAGVNSLTLNLPSGVSQTYLGTISGTLALVKAGAGEGWRGYADFDGYKHLQRTHHRFRRVFEAGRGGQYRQQLRIDHRSGGAFCV